MSEDIKRNAVGWFEIYVDDMDRAKKFYESVFSVSLEKLPFPEAEMHMFPGNMTGTGASGAIIKMDGFSAGKNSVLVYFSCEDCANEEAKVADNGGSVHKPKFSIGEHGFISLVMDSEGNMIGLHSMK